MVIYTTNDFVDALELARIDDIASRKKLFKAYQEGVGGLGPLTMCFASVWAADSTEQRPHPDLEGYLCPSDYQSLPLRNYFWVKRHVSIWVVKTCFSQGKEIFASIYVQKTDQFSEREWKGLIQWTRSIFDMSCSFTTLA